jgi:hypothetical protein
MKLIQTVNQTGAIWESTGSYMQCCGTVTIYYGSGSDF